MKVVVLDLFGPSWPGLASSSEASYLFRTLERIRNAWPDREVELELAGPFYGEEFFTTLLGLILPHEEAEWFGQVVGESDLYRDPELLRLLHRALETV